jgi:hypothetical protein
LSADQPRNRTVGCKMTDNEYERLAAVAEGDGMSLGEWVREVLLERADGRKPSVIEETQSHIRVHLSLKGRSPKNSVRPRRRQGAARLRGSRRSLAHRPYLGIGFMYSRIISKFPVFMSLMSAPTTNIPQA